MPAPLTAAAVGMFDGVHRGHQALAAQVRQAAAERGLTPAFFTFDRHPLQTVAPDRAPALLSTPAQRRHWLEPGLTVALPFGEDMRRMTAEQFMRMLRDQYGMRLIAIGFNHRFGSDRLSNFEDYKRIADSLDVEAMLAPEEGDGISSSAIRRALDAGEIAKANGMLGRPFALAGTIAHGQALGRTIGFPTANIAPDLPNQQLPREGVYAGRLMVNGDEGHTALVNIGRRPTVADKGRLSIEAHLIDYSGDIYNRPVELELTRRIRDERKFDSLDALRAQIAADKAALAAE